MELLFVTSNPHKVSEAKEGLARRASSDGAPPGLGRIEIKQCPIPYPEIQADTLEEVSASAIEWLRERPALFKEAGSDPAAPFIVEDAGLFVEGLKGFPGVFSAYVFKTVGYEGILRLLGEGDGGEERNARFSCVIGLSMPGEDPEMISGDCPGRISAGSRGGSGFGYDPVFIPDGEERTFAQMSTGEKGLLSHRGRAFGGLWDRIGGIFDP